VYDTAFVDILRDFLSGHRALRALARRWREDRLEFAEVQALVADGDEEAVLFRLKERCHALFRVGPGAVAVAREELLDLAVGALFHECMKFRENFYQLSVYGPKVRALRASGGGHPGDREGALFREFEKILAASRVRVEEALQEAEILLRQTRGELEMLLRERAGDALVTRFLVSHPEEVGQVFEQGLDALLGELHGSACAGYELAARALLESGYFLEAAEALRAAHSRAPDGSGASHLLDYAEGMQAFTERDYRSALDRLDGWLDGGAAADEASLATLALNAISRVGQLVDAAGRAELGGAASALAERIRPLARPPA
jgi:hypothetical protein